GRPERDEEKRRQDPRPHLVAERPFDRERLDLPEVEAAVVLGCSEQVDGEEVVGPDPGRRERGRDGEEPPAAPPAPTETPIGRHLLLRESDATTTRISTTQPAISRSATASAIAIRVLPGRTIEVGAFQKRIVTKRAIGAVRIEA